MENVGNARGSETDMGKELLTQRPVRLESFELLDATIADVVDDSALPQQRDTHQVVEEQNEQVDVTNHHAEEPQGQEDTMAAETRSLTVESAASFEQYASELMQWMVECQSTNNGLLATHDDALFFFETKYPEVVATNMVALFEWIAQFLEVQDADHVAVVEGDAETGAEKPEPQFTSAIKFEALGRLDEMGDLTAVANEFGLKSTLTLLYWKQEVNKSLEEDQRQQYPVSGRKSSFLHESELLTWVLAQRDGSLTKQDIITHMTLEYPDFVAMKSSAALKTWIARFLKRHLSAASGAASKALLASLPAQDEQETDVIEEEKAEVCADVQHQQQQQQQQVEKQAPIPPLPPQRKRREKRGSPEGYVLHSNEFKLNALRQLDEGKSMSELAAELGLKSQNTLVYWNSIREKLATSEKKRYRLAGGGRRSSCTFEDELLAWVTDRHQKGEGTDVKAVLDYMREYHPSFTEGKKEPTLRKWILRFFKRCWRAPMTAAGVNDVEKSYIFV